MKYSCEICLYSTNSKSHFDTHKKSKSHLAKENNNYEAKYQCDNCKKIYKSWCGYYTHKKKCITEKKKKDEDIDKKLKDEDIRQIVINLYKQNADLYKQNTEMKNMIMELSKKENVTKIENIDNTNSLNINSNNKFDIQIFLNEKCNNAIDMSSLIKNIAIGVEDIEKIENQGYVKTVTDMVAEKLNNYSVYERPLHLFVQNTENQEDEEEMSNDTIHVKDNGKWIQEDLYEHSTMLSNINTLNDAFIEKTEENESVKQIVKRGRRYDKTGKIITNILDTVKLTEEQLL